MFRADGEALRAFGRPVTFHGDRSSETLARQLARLTIARFYVRRPHATETTWRTFVSTLDTMLPTPVDYDALVHAIEVTIDGL
jgi:hypothetical protein